MLVPIGAGAAMFAKRIHGPGSPGPDSGLLQRVQGRLLHMRPDLNEDSLEEAAKEADRTAELYGIHRATLEKLTDGRGKDRIQHTVHQQRSGAPWKARSQVT